MVQKKSRRWNVKGKEPLLFFFGSKHGGGGGSKVVKGKRAGKAIRWQNLRKETGKLPVEGEWRTNRGKSFRAKHMGWGMPRWGKISCKMYTRKKGVGGGQKGVEQIGRCLKE